jgi:hypothetical protein
MRPARFLPYASGQAVRELRMSAGAHSRRDPGRMPERLFAMRNTPHQVFMAIPSLAMSAPN